MNRRQFLKNATAGSVSLISAQTHASSGSDGPLVRLVRTYATQENFSGSVFVARNGRTLFHESFGLANRAFGAGATTSTSYRVASITKAFTAVLTLQLVDEAKLRLDGMIGEYLPDFRSDAADKVTLHHLLNHTSGLPNLDTVSSYEQAAREGIPVYQLPHTTDELLQKYCSGNLLRVPGKAFDYNNADYIILGKIIERVVQGDYAQILGTRILTPLDMHSSGVLYQRDIRPGLAQTYYKTESGSLINDLPLYIENWYAAGAMFSTTGDLGKFASGLFGGKLLHPASLQKMMTPGLEEYGYGIWVRNLTIGKTMHQHLFRPGRILGANTIFLQFPASDLTIVILANTNLVSPNAFAYRIAELILK